MTVKTNIASGLKTARKAAGLSVDEVGAALGKSGKTISAWEVGRGQPDGDELIFLCKLLNVHLRDFYGDEYDSLVGETSSFADLSPDEQELVDLYRGTTDFGRRAVMNLAREYREHLPRELDDGRSLVLTADMTDDEVDDAIRRYRLANGMDVDEVV